VDATAHLLRIELKKEELYDLIAGYPAKYGAAGELGRSNAQLMAYLLKHVEARRDDPGWRSCRRRAFANDCYKYAGAIFLGITAADATAYLVRKMYPKEGNSMGSALDGRITSSCSSIYESY
jgi:hypothetical protein